MGSTIKDKLHLYIALSLFVLLVLWWLVVQYFSITEPASLNTVGQLYAAVYGVMALWGGAVGLWVSKKWGFLSSLFGRGIFSYAVGLFLQEFGQLSYSYYIYFLKVDIPYPSLGDVGYFGSIFFYIYGTYSILKLLVLGKAKVSFFSKWLVVALPVVLLITSYVLFLRNHEYTPGFSLADLLYIAYPLLQCVYVSMAFAGLVFLGAGFDGFVKRGMFLVLLALMFQYVSDFVFLYKASRSIYVAGGVTDLLYLVAYFLLTVAIIELDLVFMRVKKAR